MCGSGLGQGSGAGDWDGCLDVGTETGWEELVTEGGLGGRTQQPTNNYYASLLYGTRDACGSGLGWDS